MGQSECPPDCFHPINEICGGVIGAVADKLDDTGDMASFWLIITEGSAEIRERVNRARKLQQERFTGEPAYCNAQMTPRLIRKYCQLGAGPQTLLERAINRWGLPARAYDRILKVSRTIADLEGKEEVAEQHISEAVQYRTLDRNFWA